MTQHLSRGTCPSLAELLKAGSGHLLGLLVLSKIEASAYALETCSPAAARPAASPEQRRPGHPSSSMPGVFCRSLQIRPSALRPSPPPASPRLDSEAAHSRVLQAPCQGQGRGAGELWHPGREKVTEEEPKSDPCRGLDNPQAADSRTSSQGSFNLCQHDHSRPVSSANRRYTERVGGCACFSRPQVACSTSYW